VGRAALLDSRRYSIFARNALAGSSAPLLNSLPIWLALGNQYPETGAAPAGKPLFTRPAIRLVVGSKRGPTCVDGMARSTTLAQEAAQFANSLSAHVYDRLDPANLVRDRKGTCRSGGRVGRQRRRGWR